MNKAINYQADRQRLQEKKRKLEKQIYESIDPIAQGLLRADFREVCDQLELFYDDEPKEVKP